jgi:tetratricopeptide (TPR) repeat protein
MKKRYSCLHLGLTLVLLPLAASAFEFVPTELEWAGWPQYCQARYVTTYVGQRSPWVSTYPKAGVDLAKRQLGAATFEGVHHYCASLIWLNRARTEPDKKVRNFDLLNARDEALFSFRSLPQDSPLRGTMLITLGLVAMESGNSSDAIAFLQDAIKASPQEPTPYAAMAMAQRRLKRLDLARDVLIQGNAALAEQSPELQYNLGLVYLELNEPELAMQRAKLAYDLGSPLPGLKKKLVALGKWQDSDKTSQLVEPQR